MSSILNSMSYWAGAAVVLAVVAYLVLRPLYLAARAFWRGLRGKPDTD